MDGDCRSEMSSFIGSHPRSPFFTILPLMVGHLIVKLRFTYLDAAASERALFAYHSNA